MLSNLLKKIVTLPNKPMTLRRISRTLTRLVHDVDAKERSLEAQNVHLPDILSFDGKHSLVPCIRQENTPWSTIDLAECITPGMVTEEECKNYTYIGQFYSGSGEIVELGPWLGRSTFYIIQGLLNNPNFSEKKLHVFDDFLWRPSWMNDKVPKTEQLVRGADFQFLFDKYNEKIRDKLLVNKRKFITYDGNEDVEQLVWTGDPIEIIYVDCGRTFEANEAWWKLFSESFITDKTLLVLEDWNTHREVPVLWYNQIKQWVDSKGSTLQLVHELSSGGIATFLYRGEQQ